MKVDDIQYGLVAKDDNGEPLHFVGFEHEPTVEDAENFRKELQEDEEFGLVSVAEELTIEEADWAVIALYKNYLKEELNMDYLED